MGESDELPVILVVDDDVDHCTMLEVALECRGYRVVTAYSCREAIEILSSRVLDALVCDLTLGDGTALDVLRGVGARRPRVAIVLSGFDSDEEQERSLEAGFEAHLVKPTPIDTLIEILARGMRRPRSGMRLAKAAPSAAAPVPTAVNKTAR
jgi:DNA-binding response OmpR family regulator